MPIIPELEIRKVARPSMSSGSFEVSTPLKGWGRLTFAWLSREQLYKVHLHPDPPTITEPVTITIKDYVGGGWQTLTYACYYPFRSLLVFGVHDALHLYAVDLKSLDYRPVLRMKRDPWLGPVPEFRHLALVPVGWDLLVIHEEECIYLEVDNYARIRERWRQKKTLGDLLECVRGGVVWFSFDEEYLGFRLEDGTQVEGTVSEGVPWGG